MADNPQDFGPYFCWKKPAGETKLTPLRADVHALLRTLPGKGVHLNDIYESLPSPADSPAKKTAVRMALKDLVGFHLAQEVACTWACSPDAQSTDPMKWILRSLQQHSEEIDPGCTTDIWWGRDDIYADVRAKNPGASAYSDDDLDQALQDLYMRPRPCVKRRPQNSPTAFAPLKP